MRTSLVLLIQATIKVNLSERGFGMSLQTRLIQFFKKESYDDVDERDLEKEQPKIKRAISLKSSKVELKCNKKEQQTHCGTYQKGSRSTRMIHNKFA